MFINFPKNGYCRNCKTDLTHKLFEQLIGSLPFLFLMVILLKKYDSFLVLIPSLLAMLFLMFVCALTLPLKISRP